MDSGRVSLVIYKEKEADFIRKPLLSYPTLTFHRNQSAFSKRIGQQEYHKQQKADDMEKAEVGKELNKEATEEWATQTTNTKSDSAHEITSRKQVLWHQVRHIADA